MNYSSGKDNDIVVVLQNMQTLQKKVDILEQYIQNNVKGAANAGVNVLQQGRRIDESSSLVWRDNDNNQNNDGSNYSAVEGPVDQPTRKYPADSYSMMVLNAPVGGKWPVKNIIFFVAGLYVALFQIAGLILLTIGALQDYMSDLSNEDERTGVIKAAQILSLSFYVVFPDASLHDFAKALRYYPSSNGAIDDGYVDAMKIACILRGFQGLLAVVPVWLLIMASDSVVDVILNFSAINVISNFDEAAFAIARIGAMGPVYQEEVKRIENTDLPPCMYREIIHVRYWIGVAALNISTFGALSMTWFQY
jgi:hypothetical protein